MSEDRLELPSSPVGALSSFDVELDPVRLQLAIKLVASAAEAEQRRAVGKLIVRLFGAGLGFTAGVVTSGFIGAVILGVMGMLLSMFLYWPISTALGAVNRARLVSGANAEGLDPDDLVDAVLLCRQGKIVGYEDAINEAHRRRRQRRLRR